MNEERFGDEEEWWPKENKWPLFKPDIHDKFKFRYGADTALALLMLENYVVCLTSRATDTEVTIGLYAMCNDTFYSATADAESIPPIHFGEDLDKPFWELYDLVRQYQWIGLVIWVMSRRKQKPLPSYINKIKDLGLWKAEYDLFK